MQLKQEVFQNDESFVSQNAVEISEYFKINDLKAQLQNKDTTICKLKDTIKSLRKNTKDENVNHVKCDLEPINEEMENSMFKLELEPLPPRLLQNREVHLDYLNNTQEQANILRGLVEQAKAKQPLDGNSDLACFPSLELDVLFRISSSKLLLLHLRFVWLEERVSSTLKCCVKIYDLRAIINRLPWILLLALRGRRTGSQMCLLRNMNIRSLTVTADYFHKADHLANLCAKPLKKAAKREQRFSVPKEDDEEAFLKGSTEGFPYMRHGRAFQDEVSTLHEDKVEFPKSTVVDEDEIAASDVDDQNDYFPLDQHDWEIRIIHDNPTDVGETSGGNEVSENHGFLSHTLHVFVGPFGSNKSP
ncbi:hypothetical protein Tco_0065834 [Tanacetum coccineum]